MKLLAVIDMQNDFIDGALGNAQTAAVVEPVRKRIAQCRADGWRVVFTRDTHDEDYLDTQEGKKLPVPHCLVGTQGWQICDGLAIDGDTVLDKPAFGSMQLAAFAQKMHPQQIELIGVCTDICVISNALLIKAYLPETEVRVEADLCAGVTKESHERALEAMEVCQIEVIRK